MNEYEYIKWVRPLKDPDACKPVWSRGIALPFL